MRAGAKKWFWLALILVLAVIIVVVLRMNTGPDEVAISLVGYTNAPL